MTESAKLTNPDTTPAAVTDEMVEAGQSTQDECMKLGWGWSTQKTMRAVLSAALAVRERDAALQNEAQLAEIESALKWQSQSPESAEITK